MCLKYRKVYLLLLSGKFNFGTINIIVWKD